jgi:3-oxoacyl-[acyl-carrier-protein] synthase II
VDPADRLGRRGLRYLDRASQLALCAARDALAAAGLADGGDAGVAVVVSTNLGNLDTVCQVAETIADRGTDRVSPMALPVASSNVTAAAVATRFGLRGPNLTFTNGATSGLDALFWAGLLVGAGRCRQALVVGVETTNPTVAKLLGRSEDELLDGAAAVVVGAAPGARPLARLGRYARRPGVAACVEEVLAGSPAPGLWLTDGPVDPPPPVRAQETDLTAVFGAASGALGVLQCAAAVGWFAAGATEAALLTAGSDRDDAVAAQLLEPGPGERP